MMAQLKVGETKQDEPELSRTNLYIRNVPKEWNNANLIKFFSKYHPQSARVLVGKHCGFVNFANHTDAVNALQEFQNKRPYASLTAIPVWITFARQSKLRSLPFGRGSDHGSFWKERVENGRVIRERDLDKLQQLIFDFPKFAVYHYEFACGLQSLMNSNRLNKTLNTVTLWLKHINIAIELSEEKDAMNRPTFAWVKRKIDFCIPLYRTDDNCYNIDIDELIMVAWDAVLNYNKYYFYTLYIQLLHTTQREEYVSEALQLYVSIWCVCICHTSEVVSLVCVCLCLRNGNERWRFFQKYDDMTRFLRCMMRNGCNLDEMMKVIGECWRRYDDEYDLQKDVKFEEQTPPQKNATFAVYLISRRFVEHICNEYAWKVSDNILTQSIIWLEMTLSIRPYYGVTYVLLGFYYFSAANNYVKARGILENGIKTNGDKCIHDALSECVEESGSAQGRWNLFVGWVNSKILKKDRDDLMMEGEEKETPMMDHEEQPGSKLNIDII